MYQWRNDIIKGTNLWRLRLCVIEHALILYTHPWLKLNTLYASRKTIAKNIGVDFGLLALGGHRCYDAHQKFLSYLLGRLNSCKIDCKDCHRLTPPKTTPIVVVTSGHFEKCLGTLCQNFFAVTSPLLNPKAEDTNTTNGTTAGKQKVNVSSTKVH